MKKLMYVLKRLAVGALWTTAILAFIFVPPIIITLIFPRVPVMYALLGWYFAFMGLLGLYGIGDAVL